MIQYQGHLTDALGAPLDTAINMTFTIYDDPLEGSVWWTETQDSVMVVNGLFHVLLESVNGIIDDFDFMVTAVRKGHEDYEVIRASIETQPVERGATRDKSPVQLMQRPGR
jgi:hypothetical protein